MTAQNNKVRIAAVGDLHCPKNSDAVLQPLFSQINDGADILLLCGDLTDYGRPEEAQMLAKALGIVKIPILAVLGNHDYECGKADLVERILCDVGVHMLNGESYILHGIGFVGVKGFAGGFGDRALQPWGEEALKHFVREAVDEALRLESALAKLQVPQRIAFLHYSPIQATVQGEAPEVVPFLGSSKLEDPLNRYTVLAAFHGHAHHGTPEGRTQNDIPVYNVAMPVLRQAFPDRPPFRLLEILTEGTSS
jgi:Icc-related predicted phosphoesterase